MPGTCSIITWLCYSSECNTQPNSPIQAVRMLRGAYQVRHLPIHCQWHLVTQNVIPGLWSGMSNPLLQVCICGHSFSDPGAFKRHKKNCHKGKKRLSSMLTKAKELYQWKKACIQNTSESKCDSPTPVVDNPTVGLSPDLRVNREGTDSSVSQVVFLMLKRYTKHWSALAYCTRPTAACSCGHWRWWHVSCTTSPAAAQPTPTPSFQRCIARASDAPTPGCHEYCAACSYGHTYLHLCTCA